MPDTIAEAVAWTLSHLSPGMAALSILIVFSAGWWISQIRIRPPRPTLPSNAGLPPHNQLWSQYQLVLAQLAVADSKLHALLLLGGATIAFAFKLALDTRWSLVDHPVLTALGVLLSALFFLFVWRGLAARVDTQHDPGSANRSLTFFMHIARLPNPQAYVTALASRSPTEASIDIAYQIWDVSMLARQKFWLYRIAWTMFLLMYVLLAPVLLWIGQNGVGSSCTS